MRSPLGLSAYSGRLSTPGAGVPVVPTGMVRVDYTNPLTNGLVGLWLPGVMKGIDPTGLMPELTVPLSSAANFNGIHKEGWGLASLTSNTHLQSIQLSTGYYTLLPQFKWAQDGGSFSGMWRGQV